MAHFFVYVIESPSPIDLYHKRTEGDLVAQALSLDGIPSATRTAINAEAFQAALTLGLAEEMDARPGLPPIVHLSAHGSSAGITLSSGDVVTWPALKALLVPLNRYLGGHLLVCMSSCEGYSACQMAMTIEDADPPYFAVIGNAGTPTWSDTAVAYSSFYHLLAKGVDVPVAIEAMKYASGDPNWAGTTAEQARRGFLEYLTASFDTNRVTTQLQDQAQQLPPGAKSLASAKP
jgi:hypothetical protein